MEQVKADEKAPVAKVLSLDEQTQLLTDAVKRVTNAKASLEKQRADFEHAEQFHVDAVTHFRKVKADFDNTLQESLSHLSPSDVVNPERK